jgi:hypothetical protein
MKKKRMQVIPPVMFTSSKSRKREILIIAKGKYNLSKMDERFLNRHSSIRKVLKVIE